MKIYHKPFIIDKDDDFILIPTIAIAYFKNEKNIGIGIGIRFAYFIFFSFAIKLKRTV